MGKRSILRPTSGGSVAYEAWQDEAPCRGLPYHWFELQEFKESRREKQHKPIAKGLKVCSTCPVRKLCGLEATEVDRYYTTRGGQPPEGLFEDASLPKLASRPRSRKSPVSGARELCSKGHNDWVSSGVGRRSCDTCRKLRAAKQPLQRGKCRKGHDNWIMRSDGRRRCATCQQINSADEWQRRKVRMKLAKEAG